MFTVKYNIISLSKFLDFNLSLNNSCLINPRKCGNPNCLKILTNSSDLVPIPSTYLMPILIYFYIRRNNFHCFNINKTIKRCYSTK